MTRRQASSLREASSAVRWNIPGGEGLTLGTPTPHVVLGTSPPPRISSWPLPLPPAEQEESVTGNLNHHVSQALQQRRQNPIALESWSDPGPTHGWGRNGHGHWPHIPCHNCPRKKHHRGPQTTQDQSRALPPERARKGGLGTPSSVRAGSETSYQQLPSLSGPFSSSSG